jgi:ribonuclease E
MVKVMLVNVVEPEESRIAIVEDGQLEELYIERARREQIVGNIYKARVATVERSLQACFVEFGGKRQGFLHASDLAGRWRSGGRRSAKEGRESDAPIQDVLQKGQDIIVQVSKEGIRNKAPAVTTFISLPGRYLVLMPAVSHRLGVSRKIGSDEERSRLREALQGLDVPSGYGVIARTAAADRTRRELQRDLNYLVRLYQEVEHRFREETGPALLYEESDLIIRAVRDIFSTDIHEMVVDSEEEYKKILQFMKATMPSYRRRVRLYHQPEPLFHRYDIEGQIDQIYRKRVTLKSGGSIVIEQTEALVAIDVNTGRFKREDTAEDTAFKQNLEAAKEIPRQIRLRDLGGLIINDFIDMEDENHIRDVERTLWEGFKRDRARTKMLRMSKFGIIEMTRQRVRQNPESTSYDVCPTCRGTGQVLTLDSVALAAYRRLRAAVHQEGIKRLAIHVAAPVAEFLLNRKRREITGVEDANDVQVEIVSEPDYAVDKVEIKSYTDVSGNK